MKNLIKILALSFLLYCVPIISMEQGDDSVIEISSEESKLDLVAGLPNELWELILYSVYFDQNIMEENCKDIYANLNCLKMRLSLCQKNIRLTCKTFNCLNNLTDKKFLKDKLRKYYRPLLTEKFLKLRNGGLYPKNYMWSFVGKDNNNFIGKHNISKEIASFLANENEINHGLLLQKIIDNSSIGSDLKEKAIGLLLFYGLNVHAKTTWDEPCLHYAILIHKCFDLKKIVQLLAHNSEIDIRNDLGYTGICFAISLLPSIGKIEEIIQILLNCGADINIQNNNGETALHLAVMRHGISNIRSEMVKMLLAHGVDVNTKDNKGYTALYYVIFCHKEDNNMKEILQILLSNEVDVDSQDNDGNTALHHVILGHGYLGGRRFTGDEKEIIKMLLAHGANVDLRNGNGKTARILAEERGILWEELQIYNSNRIVISKKSDFCALM